MLALLEQTAADGGSGSSGGTAGAERLEGMVAGAAVAHVVDRAHFYSTLVPRLDSFIALQPMHI